LVIELRSVTREDWDFIMLLRNEFYNFFYKQTKPITKNEHYDYMEKQLSNSNFHHWIISSDKKTVGYCRILNEDVGIMIKKEFQNEGIASKALRLLEDQAQNLGIKKLIALVKTGNESSSKIFLKNNFKLKMYWYEKEIVEK